MLFLVLSHYSAANKKQKAATPKVDVAATTPVKKNKDANETSPCKEAAAKELSPADELIDIEKAQYTFPERLMELLGNDSVKKALWWLPGGEAFALMPNVFYDIVLAKYFQGTKFESFTRKLNRWGFKRLSGQGVPKGSIAYYHKMFKKEKPEMAKKLRSGKNSQSQNESHSARLSALDQAMQLNPMLAAQMNAPAATTLDPTALLMAQAQQAGLMQGAARKEQTSIQLRLLQQQVNQEAALKQLATMQQILSQEQHQNAQMNALAHFGGARSGSLGPGLLGIESIRTAQEAALAQAQLRARLFEGNTPASAGLGIASAQHQLNQPSDDQIRLALLRQQLANQGGLW